jgi:hypothetical protein
MSDGHQWTNPDLDSLIDDAVDTFRGDSQRWDDAELGKFINELADKLAAYLLDSAESLVGGDHADLLRKIPTDLPTNPTFPYYAQIFEALQLRLAGKYLGSTRQMAERAFELLTMVIGGSPKEQVRRFLSRVARCYILGLAPECAVFARASVENALNEKYHVAGTPWPRNDKGESPVSVRIARANEIGWLSESAARDAREIWTRGSKSAHADPDIVQQARDTVSAATRVLNELYR